MSRFTLRQLLARGPVMSPVNRQRTFSEARPSGVPYAGGPRHACPILPIMPFGIAYDLDLVIATRHPAWDMHELARLATPDGPVWFAKDARSDTLEQSIVSDVPDLNDWLPELPVPRKPFPVEVDDQSQGDALDLRIAWETPGEERACVHYRGPAPSRPQTKRNGSTMGHSRGSLIAALDLSHRDWARRVDVSYDDTPCPLLRLFLVKPFGLALRQTQGGFVTGSYTQRATSDGLVVTHSRGDETWRQPWTIASEDGGVAVTQTDPLRTITHRFLEEGDALELREITVTQFGREHAPMRALFSPALPDLRRPFEGTATSRWVLDINGQQSHAIGLATATWGEVGTKVDLRGSAPWWVADRPMAITVRCDEGSGMASVRVARTD